MVSCLLRTNTIEGVLGREGGREVERKKLVVKLPGVKV